MNHPLDGIREKIIRAEHHLDTIRSEVAGHKEQCGLVGKKNINTGKVDFSLEFPDPPLLLSVIIGDCLHNLRSTLDHLVWQLVENNPPHHGIRRNQFPICIDSVAFNAELVGHRLDGVPSRAITLIEKLQPYQSFKPPQLSPLWRLNDLVNTDKHKTLALTHSVAHELLASFSHPDRPSLQKGVAWRGVSGYDPLSNGTPFLSIDGTDFYPLLDDPEKVKMHIKSGVQITFQDASVGGGEIDALLSQFVNFIKNGVIPRFEPFF